MISLAKNPTLSDHSKHIRVYYYNIRDLQERQRVDIQYVLITKIIADRLSKPFLNY
jgi:hypothetical protein